MSLSEDFLMFFELFEDKQGISTLFQDDSLDELNHYGEFHQVVEAVSQKIHKPEYIALLVLRSLANQKSELRSSLADISFVSTFPDQANVDSRHTPQIVREMIQSAKEEILIAGYAITESGGLLELLLESQKTVRRITMIGSSWKSNSGVNEMAKIANEWPSDKPKPDIYQYSNSKDNTTMHIKCLVIDGREMLIGSANFTYSGMNRNFELGVKIKGDIVQSARRIFESLLKSKEFQKL